MDYLPKTFLSQPQKFQALNVGFSKIHILKIPRLQVAKIKGFKN